MNIAVAVFGANHPQFTKAPKPLNILTCIDRADKYLDAHCFRGKTTGMLRDGYDWLSEFAHPNFLSNNSAFTVDKANRRFVFRHEDNIQESDLQLLGYLDSSAFLFIRLFDDDIHRLTENGLTK